MKRKLSVLGALVAFAASAACGSEDGLVAVDDGLIDPPPAPSKTGSTSSSSSSSSSSGNPSQPTDPGTSSGSSSSSGGPVEAACDPNAALSPYSDVGGIPAEASWLRLTGDELRAFFVLPQAGSARIFGASRDALEQPFSNVVELGPAVNRGSDTSAPLVTDDGLTLTFSVGGSIWSASRAAVGQPFSDAALKLQNARSEVLARDASLQIFSRYERYPQGIGNYRWVARGQPPGAPEMRVAIDAVPTWYEPLSKQLWILQGAQASIFTWADGWSLHTSNTPFQVTWTSPNGCRLYGIVDGHPAMRSRTVAP